MRTTHILKPIKQQVPSASISVIILAIAILSLTATNSYASGPWEKIWGPVGLVLFRDAAGTSETFATKGSNLNPTGDIYSYLGTPMKWTKIGGPGKKFVVGPTTPTEPYLVGLSPDKNGVWLMEYISKPGEAGEVEDKWKKIGGPAGDIFGGDAGIFATNPTSGDVWQYNGTPMNWTKIGGPGKMFAVGKKNVYGLSPDGSGVWQYSGVPMKWTKIGGPAGSIYTGGNKLYATNPKTGDIWQYNGTPMKWTKIGGPGKMFAVSNSGALFGLSPDGSGVWQYSGVPMKWTKIGGAAESIFAGHVLGALVCATNPNTHDLWCYSP